MEPKPRKDDKMKRKGLAILLAFCLVMSLLPILANAAVSDESASVSISGKYEEPFPVVKGGRIVIESVQSDKSYYWEEVSNDGIVEISNDDAGKPLWLKAVKVGTATFKMVVGDKSVSFAVQVLSDKEGISLSPDSIVVAKGKTKTVKAYYSTGTTHTSSPYYSWGSADSGIASVTQGSEKNIGVIKGESVGVTTITANYNNHSQFCTVMVEEPYEVKYSENENGVITGEKKAVRTDPVYVTIKPKDNYRVTSVKAVRDDTGEVEASANLTGAGDKTWEFEMPDCDVTVSAEYAVIDETKKPLKGITLSEEAAEVPVNAQFALNVTLDPEDTTDDKSVEWTSSNELIATVEKGIVTGIKAGKATITATVGDFSKECVVTVKDALTEVSTDPKSLTLVAGKSETVEVAYKTSENDHLIAKWESKDPTVATVDQTGKVTGRNIGETEITVTVGGKSSSVKVTIKKSEGDFSVKINEAKNGTIVSSKSKADKDEFVSLTVKPAAGYELGELEVVDKDANPIELDSDSDNEFIFQMPESDVVVTAAFSKKEAKPETKGFIDVPSGSWYEEAVNYVAEKGYLDGVGNNRFNPKGAVTRGQLCTILYAMEGKPTVTAGSVFPDVGVSKYYYDPIRWAATKGMVAGYTDGTFKPDVFVSRQQLAAVLYKYTVYKGFDVSVSADITKFADYSSISNYAVSPLRWAVSHKIMSGTNTNRLEPQSAATRAEFAVMLKAYDANVRK